MWLVHPVRTSDNHKNQIHKSREQTLALTSVLFNTTLTTIIAATLMEGEGRLTSHGLPANLEFLLVGGGPAILCHLLGCFFLALHYAFTHTWRRMGDERGFGKYGFFSRISHQQNSVVAETPFWEQVA